MLEQKSGAFPSHIALLVVVLFSVDGLSTEEDITDEVHGTVLYQLDGKLN